MRSSNFALGALAALAVALPPNLLHTRLVKAEPGIDATVNQVPRQIRLWWSDRTEAPLTSATLLTADKSPVAVVRMAETDDSLSTAGPISVTLAPGKYLILWKTASRDGHVVRGRYGFTFDPGARP